jgi:hypothetical protein
MNTVKQILPVFLAFLFAACGGGESSDYSASSAEEAPEAAPEAYSGPNADLVAEFDAAGVVFMHAIEGVEGDAWTFRESEDRWSIAEVCEHIIMAEQGLVGGFVAGLVSGEANADPSAANTEMDEGVRAFSRDRSNPVQTNEAMEPKGIYATPDEAIAAFSEVRAGTLEFLKTSEVDFRAYSGTLTPEIEPMDAYQWLVFAAGHTERHSAQIDQVKAHEGYPGM